MNLHEFHSRPTLGCFRMFECSFCNYLEDSKKTMTKFLVHQCEFSWGSYGQGKLNKWQKSNGDTSFLENPHPNQLGRVGTLSHCGIKSPKVPSTRKEGARDITLSLNTPLTSHFPQISLSYNDFHVLHPNMTLTISTLDSTIFLSTSSLSFFAV